MPDDALPTYGPTNIHGDFSKLMHSEIHLAGDPPIWLLASPSVSGGAGLPVWPAMADNTCGESHGSCGDLLLSVFGVATPSEQSHQPTAFSFGQRLIFRATRFN